MTVRPDPAGGGVRVLFFGALRERLQCGDVVVNEPVRTVADLWAAVTTSRADVAAMRAGVRCARNLEYCDWDTAVAAGDEVAFMPPVCGGSANHSAAIAVSLTDVAIDVGTLVAQAGTSGDGAVSCFVGRVRDVSGGERIHRLDYEAYAPMALAEMRRIATAACERHPLTTITLVHRTGELEVGDVAVAVVTASAHREAALASCREVIDEVKRDVPIWKREHSATGARWVDARC